LQPFLQQLDEHGRRFRLLLSGNLLDDSQNRSLNQQAQHYVVSAPMSLVLRHRNQEF